MNRTLGKKISIPSLLACSALFFVQGAFAHGYMSEPPSRPLICKNNMGNEACRNITASGQSEAIYTPQGIQYRGVDYLDYEQALPDGQICGGKNAYSGLDMAPAKWVKTAVKPNASEQIKLTYQFTAHHGTDHIRYYITKNGFNPNKKLAWSDLEPMAQFDNVAPPPAGGKWTETVKIPSRQRGNHVIVTMWPVSRGHGTNELFISCADVDLQGDHAVSWISIGPGVSAKQDLKAGAEVKFRLFDHSRAGIPVGEVTMVLSKDMQDAEWLYALADKANKAGLPAQIGSLQNGKVTLKPGSNTYQVYAEKANYNYEIDVKANGNENTPGLPPQAIVGGDINAVATTSAGFAYKLNGGKSLNAVKHEWQKLSGPFDLRHADQADAEAVVRKGQTGESTYQLTVTSKEGKQHSSTVKVTAVAPKASITGATSVTQGQAASLKAQANFAGASGSAPAYAWTVHHKTGAEALKGAGQQLNLSTLAVGSYQATVEISSPHGGRKATAQHDIEVAKKAPVEVIEGVCQDLPQWEKKQYKGGANVQKNGRSYTAKWSTELHHAPGTAGWQGEPWKDNGACK